MCNKVCSTNLICLSASLVILAASNSDFLTTQPVKLDLNSLIID